jgi:hypothetical protein
MVWSDNNGQPGDSIAGLTDTIKINMGGQYQRFYLKTSILLPKTFYIGWQQINLVFLNIGFDRNRSSMDKVQINLNDGQGWLPSKSLISGALMMRPVVGSRQMAYSNVQNFLIEKLKVYPNPATDFVKIEIPNELVGSKNIIQFYDITGKVAFTCQNSDQNINISSLNKGLYLIRIQDKSGQVFNARLVKN